MSKNFLWSILLIVLNILILFLNYSKDFTLPLSFFIEMNQMIAFLIGMLYANQYRKFGFKYILGIASNSLIYSIFMTVLFSVFGAPVTMVFTLLCFCFIFISIFLGYSLFYICFCPKSYKKRKKKNTSRNIDNTNKADKKNKRNRKNRNKKVR